MIVPGSGTGELAGITGTGGIEIDADGTHRVWFEYEVDARRPSDPHEPA